MGLFDDALKVKKDYLKYEGKDVQDLESVFKEDLRSRLSCNVLDDHEFLQSIAQFMACFTLWRSNDALEAFHCHGKLSEAEMLQANCSAAREILNFLKTQSSLGSEMDMEGWSSFRKKLLSVDRVMPNGKTPMDIINEYDNPDEALNGWEEFVNEELSETSIRNIIYKNSGIMGYIALEPFVWAVDDRWPHAGFAKTLDDSIQTIEDPEDRKFLERTAPQMKLGPDLLPVEDVELYRRIFKLGGGGSLNSRYWVEDRHDEQ